MATARTSIADLSKWSPPMRRRSDGDGDFVIEKLSPLMGVLAIDMAGNEATLPLANGISHTDRTNPYRMQILPEKLRGGFIQVGLCPLGVTDSIEHLPKSVRFEPGKDGKPDESRPRPPCVKSADGGKITALTPCKCIAEIAKIRRERNAKKEAEREKRTGGVYRLAEITAEQNLTSTANLAKAAEGLVRMGEALTAAAKKGDGK